MPSQSSPFGSFSTRLSVFARLLTFKAVCLLIIVTMLTNPILALPRIGNDLAVTANEYKNDLRYSPLLNNLGANFGAGTRTIAGINSLIDSLKGKKQQGIERITIVPFQANGELTIMQGEKIN